MRKDGRGWAITPSGEYPADWNEIARAIKEREHWRCECCGMEFIPGTNFAVSAVNVKGKPLLLTIHHLNGDKSDCRWENCLVACQICHLKVQWLWGPGDPLPPQWAEAPAWMIKRGLEYQPRQQLQLI